MAPNAMIIGETDLAGAGESQPHIQLRRETRRTDTVKTATMDPRAFAGLRIEGPGGMMRTISQPVEPAERQDRFV